MRDEVVEQIALGSPGLTGLAEDWRKLLFPQADDAQFADGYAQAVTFGLLVARSRDISLKDGIHHAAHELRGSNSLIATALGLLTDTAENQEALKTSLGTLRRVLDAVDWHEISRDKPEAWLYFYENFLEVYDNTLRKRTGLPDGTLCEPPIVEFYYKRDDLGDPLLTAQHIRLEAGLAF